MQLIRVFKMFKFTLKANLRSEQYFEYINTVKAVLIFKML